jgi:hypothetical protein
VVAEASGAAISGAVGLAKEISFFNRFHLQTTIRPPVLQFLISRNVEELDYYFLPHY